MGDLRSSEIGSQQEHCSKKWSSLCVTGYLPGPKPENHMLSCLEPHLHGHARGVNHAVCGWAGAGAVGHCAHVMAARVVHGGLGSCRIHQNADVRCVRTRVACNLSQPQSCQR